MLDRLKSEGFNARLKDTIGLVRETLSVFGKDADIIKPIIGMIIMQSIATGALLFGIALIVFSSVGGSALIGILLILLSIPLLGFTLFYDAFQRAKVTALSYAVAKGEDATIPGAKARIKPIKGTLFLVGLIDTLVSAGKSKSRDSKGIAGIIISILMNVLAEVWDLVSNFLLPAVVIEQKGPNKVVGELRELKRNAPAALVGVLGFDAFGSIASRLVAGLFILVGLIGIGAPILLFGFGTITFVTTLVSIAVIVVGSSIIGKLVIGAKSVYFTLFYLALTRPHEISPQMRATCTHLLPAEANRAGSTSPAEKLIGIVRQLRERGGTEAQIMTFLTEKGFDTNDIKAAIEQTR